VNDVSILHPGHPTYCSSVKTIFYMYENNLSLAGS